MEREDGQQPQEEQVPMSPPQTPDEQAASDVTDMQSEEASVELQSQDDAISEPQAPEDELPEPQEQAGPSDETQSATSLNATETSPPKPEKPQSDAVATEPRNFLAAFMLLITFGYLGLHQVYLGNKTQGWVRFGLGIASFPLTFVFIGFFIMLVLGIWAIVDFFTLYLGKSVDAEGQALAKSSLDSAWAQTIFIAALATVGFFVLSIAAVIALSLFTGFQFMNSPSRSVPESPGYYSIRD